MLVRQPKKEHSNGTVLAERTNTSTGHDVTLKPLYTVSFRRWEVAGASHNTT